MDAASGHHRALARQLRRQGLDPSAVPDAKSWAMFLDAVSRSYDESDADRYLLERSIEISSAEMRALHEELSRQARTDALTGLPNRVALLDVLADRLAAGRSGPQPALMFIDLDGFKGVNDTWGHGVGDELLVRAAERIKACLSPADIVSRLGGDEFVAIVVSPASLEAVTETGAEVVRRLCSPFRIAEQDLRIGASVGIALAEGSVLPGELLQHADIAMYDAKLRGKGVVSVFDAVMRARTVERLSTEAALRMAVERDELRLHYQPVIRLSDGAVVGAEALLRWERPGHGLIVPDLFLELAEETRLVTALDSWVVGRACADAVGWPPGVVVTVNMSARDLAIDDFADRIAGVIGRSGLSARRLVVELTESSMLTARPAAAENLARLRSLGVRLAVDDFGTGYSSLAYLRRLDAHVVKIDRSFVSEVDRDATDAAIVGAVVDMCRALGLHVVAEGVERPEQVEVLRQLGCFGAQGFQFARPMPAEELTEYLRRMPVSASAGRFVPAQRRRGRQPSRPPLSESVSALKSVQRPAASSDA